MRRNKIRQLQLALIALAFSTLALLYLVLAIGFWQYANAESVITARPTPPQTLVQQCAYLKESHDPGEWNAETDSYEPNHAWWDCMGVGIK